MNAALQAELDQALTATVEEMRLAVEQLADALQSERTALATGNVEALNQAGASKHALMVRLEQLVLEAERHFRKVEGYRGLATIAVAIE